MVPFAVAGVQMHVSASQENVTAMKHKVAHIATVFPWVQMIVFSELAAFGPLTNRRAEDYGAVESEFCELAARHGLWILPGSMFEELDGTIYNTASVIGPKGDVVGRYRKMFPFAPYEAGVASGTEFLVFDVEQVGRFGVSICYDIWFPETTRTLTSMGAEVLLHPVMTGTVDRNVELSIARANAAMFQCYVFDINGVGAGGAGQSTIIDPAGCVLHLASAQEQIIPVEIDLELVRRQRAVGLMGLGQLHKSFRDRVVDFGVYDRDRFDEAYLKGLGPLTMPERGSKAGLTDTDPPRPTALRVATENPQMRRAQK